MQRREVQHLRVSKPVGWDPSASAFENVGRIWIVPRSRHRKRVDDGGRRK